MCKNNGIKKSMIQERVKRECAKVCAEVRSYDKAITCFVGDG